MLLVALYLLGSSWVNRNSYALVFALLALVTLFVFSFLARLQAFRTGGVILNWDWKRPLYARLGEQGQTFHTDGRKPLYFFRYHLLLKGKFYVGRNAYFYFRQEAAASDGGEIFLPLNFPVCGRLEVTSSLQLRDVFGFVRAPVGKEDFRKIIIRPPHFPDNTRRRYLSMFTDDSLRKVRDAEEEKYYMRDYVPGDRLKDINWKASIRVNELITRISPISPERSQLMHIDFRHFNVREEDSPAAIMHLNYAKSWMISFMTAVKREHHNCRFRVLTGEGPTFLNTEDEIEQFALALSHLNFIPESAALPDQDEHAANSAEKFVFTTHFDRGLQDYINRRPQTRFNVFRTVRKQGERGERVRTINFLGNPGLELIPGPWITRRQPSTSPNITVRGFLQEENLKVRVV